MNSPDSSQPSFLGHSPRDWQILEHVLRYRITTNEVIRKRFFRGRQRPNAVAKVTARLCRARLLAKYPLYHPRIYFVLGPVGCQHLGVSTHRSLPLGPQALPTEYAALAYSQLGTARHQRLTRAELRQRYPWLTPALAEFPHCLDESQGTSVLELIRVDLGGKSDHVVRKCLSDLDSRRTLSPFLSLLKQKQFRLVVMTGTPEKATAIQNSLAQHVWPDGFSIHLAIVQDLLQLTARLNHDT